MTDNQRLEYIKKYLPKDQIDNGIRLLEKGIANYNTFLNILLIFQSLR